MKHIRIILNLVIIFSIVMPVRAMRGMDSAPMRQTKNEILPESDLGYVPNRVIVKLRSSSQIMSQDQSTLNDLLTAYGVKETRKFYDAVSVSSKLSQIYVLELFPGSDLERFIGALLADPNVEWAEPDYLAYPVATVPDDPLFPEQWGLDKIDVSTAWDTTTGSVTVPIAIIDSGIYTSHPDLISRLWVNPGEIAGNGVDDDNNGYIDDVNGWNFVGDDNNPADDNGHGTQVAGIAGAASDNGSGIAGLCWNCPLMNVKVMNAAGVANYSDIAAGVLYAVQKGAKVINLSLGGYSNSSALQSAVQDAVDIYGAVLVAGAGNDNLQTPFYPAAYPEVLAVAGTNQTDAKSAFSNYGDWVDVAAPAVAITTTFQGGDYGTVDGTSYAAPFVAGLAGLLRSQHSDWSANTVRAQIVQTADTITGLNNAFSSDLGSGRINAATAVSTLAQPLLAITSHAIDDVPNGRPEPGATVDLDVTLYNDWADASDVQAILTSSSQYVTIVTDSASYDSIPAFGSETNSTSFRFSVSEAAPYSHDLSFTLSVTAGGGYSTNIPVIITTRSSIQNVSGLISSNTTWTSDKEYHVTGNILVQAGVILTIEDGTMIKVDAGKIIQIEGGLVAIGEAEQQITFTSNAENPSPGDWEGIQFNDSSVDAQFGSDYQYISGSILQFSIIEYAQTGVFCSNASPGIINSTIRNNMGTGIIAGESAAYPDSHPTIYYNMISDNYSGIQMANTVTVTHNVIRDNSGYGVLFDAGGSDLHPGLLKHNLISNNGDEGLLVRANGVMSITENTIIGNNIGVNLEDGGSPSTFFFERNNLVRNSQYAFQNNTALQIDLPNNWWDSTNTSVIDSHIYDWQDDFNLGIVDYAPILTHPDPIAPAYVVDVTISPDTTLGIQTATFDVAFSRAMSETVAFELSFQSAKHETWTVYDKYNSDLPDDIVNSIAADPDGSLWFGTSDGLAHFDGTTWAIYNTYNSSLLQNHIHSIATVPDGSHWFGTAAGAVQFDGTTWLSYNHILPDGSIYTIGADPDGSYWFGSDTGVAYYDGNNATTYNSYNSSLPDNHVFAIATDPDGTHWFGTNNGLAHFDGVNWTNYNTSNSDLPENRITSLAIKPNNSIWIGTYGGGLANLNGSTWTIYESMTSDLPEDSISSLFADPDGSLWIGTMGSGVANFGVANWTVYKTENSGLPNSYVNAIATDAQGSHWFATEGGGAAVLWNYPTYPITDNAQWLDDHTYQATYDITSLTPRGDYVVNIGETIGTDGIEIAPTVGFTFTIDYAGAIGDTTPPNPPTVTACAGSTNDNLSAEWTASDPDSVITMYSYAIGTTPGGSDVVNWINTTSKSFNRSGLTLVSGQPYYVSVKARNEGGLWSTPAVPDAVYSGSGVCSTTTVFVFLPLVIH